MADNKLTSPSYESQEGPHPLRIESGQVNDIDPLVSLFYDLLRDHVHPGDLEGLVQAIERSRGQTVQFTNGFLARYAQNLVERLRRLPAEVPKHVAQDTPPATEPMISHRDIEWIVNSRAELGVKVGNTFAFLYKGNSLSYQVPDAHEDGTPMQWRHVLKREFGECCHPPHHDWTDSPKPPVPVNGLNAGERYMWGRNWQDLPPNLWKDLPQAQALNPNVDVDLVGHVRPGPGEDHG